MSEKQQDQSEYIGLFNQYLFEMFDDVVEFVKDNPKLAYFLLKTAKNQKKAEKTRGRWEKKGVHVPPFLIMSITGECNLKCRGCYAKQWRDVDGAKLSTERISEIFEEAEELGISIIMLAGGEPMMRKNVLELAALHPKIIFPVFTNGLLIDDEMVKLFKKHKNLIPVISLEGGELETDRRRGDGAFSGVGSGFEKLKTAGVFFGTSITVTNTNLDTVTSDDFIDTIMDQGAKLFFYVEYIPVKKGSEDLVPDQSQRDALISRTQQLRENRSGLFIAFPGDEDMFGGCLSAGRGFVHINPLGHLEPCPFAPYHDCDLKETSLKEGLNSNFLRELRSNRERLSETSGGCALWTQQDWVRAVLSREE